MARFVIDCHYPDAPWSRQLYVTSEARPALTGVPLRDGGEILFRGRRWRVRLLRESVHRYVLTPLPA